jgi:hypothetical protein
MREYSRNLKNNHKFSLHDANIIDFEKRGSDLILKTDYGFIDTETDRMVEGNICLEDVSFEDSYLYLMKFQENLPGNMGIFSGEKMTLATFLSRKISSFRNFNVMNEYEGYSSLYLNGFLFLDKDIYEVSFEIYLRGDLVYQVL